MMKLPTITLITGILLVAVGVGGFAGAGFATKALTALIPAVFGLLIGSCGILALRNPQQKGALRAAWVFGLLGFLLPAGRLVMVAVKGNFAWKLSTIMLLVAATICLVFVGFCLRSFVEARGSRGS